MSTPGSDQNLLLNMSDLTARNEFYTPLMQTSAIELDASNVEEGDEFSEHLIPLAQGSPQELGTSNNVGYFSASDQLLPARQAFVTTTEPRRPSLTTQCSHPYAPISVVEQEKLMREFSHRHQLQKILGKGFLLWIRTVAILLLLGTVLWAYHRKAVMSMSDKNMFNVLMTAGSILLGLNVAAALHEMTLNMRWFFLSRRSRPLAEVDTIIKSDISQFDSFLLNPKPWAASIPVLWLLVNIGSQIGVACLGLTYSIDLESRAVLMKTGNANITNLSSFFAYGSSNDTLEQDVRWAANNFGNTALLSSPYDTIDKAPASGAAYNSLESKIWVNPDLTGHGYWQYRFLSSTSSGSFQPGLLPTASVYTNRSINATWSCGAWRVLSPSGDGTYLNITYVDDENTGHTSYYMLPTVQPAQTSFWTASQTGYYNPRMAHIMAFEPDFTSPWLYTCNITVSEVSNAKRPEHNISDYIAFTAATGIALGALDVTVTQGNVTFIHRTQRYPQQSSGYGAKCGGDYQTMGMNIAHFAIGAISVADKFNPRLTVPGTEPKAGFSLTIPQVKYLIAIFALVLGVQLVLLLITSFVANQVIVTDDSPIAIARLFDPIVARLNNAGTIADEKELVQVLEKEDPGHHMRVAYTVHVDPEKDHDHPEKWRVVLSDEKVRRAMDDGKYY